MSQHVQLLHGWFTLHDFRRFDRKAFELLSERDRQACKESLNMFWQMQSHAEATKVGSFGVYEVLGHKADLLFLTLRPDLEALAQMKRQPRVSFWDLFKPATSYLGVVELSNYVVHSQTSEDDPMIVGRLKPTLPQRRHVCFYPMNKKREGQDNWYLLPNEERQRMMKSHGMVGRRYAGEVTQMISGSIGLDDYEWAVTLFADDPLSFKRVVTEMRFDEVSARYAEFGHFLVGNRLDKDSFWALLMG